MARQRPETFSELFPELNIQTREISRHSGRWCGHILWIIISVCTTFAFVEQCYALTTRYLSFSTVTHYSEVGTSKIGYPDLVICADNAVNFTKMKSAPYNISHNLAYFLLTPFMYSSTTYDPRQTTTIDWDIDPVDGGVRVARLGGSEISEEYSNFTDRIFGTRDISLETVMNEFIPEPAAILTECYQKWLKTPCFPDNYKLNDADDYYPNMKGFSRTGFCFVLPQPEAKQTIPGRSGSWTLGLHRHPDLDPTIYNLKYASQFYHIHFTLLSNESESGLLSTSPLIVSPKSYTGVSLSKKKVLKEPVPYGDCQQRTSYLESVEQNHYTSGVQILEYCCKETELKVALKACENLTRACLPLGHFGLLKSNLTVCDPGVETSCMRHYALNTSCEDCKLPCNIVEWDKSITTAENPTSSRHTYVDIYTEHMILTELSEVPSDTMVDLISSIGGQFSLWLGFKISTIVQIIYYGLCWTIFRPCNKPKQKDSQNENSKNNNNKVVPISWTRNSFLEDTVVPERRQPLRNRRFSADYDNSHIYNGLSKYKGKF